MKKKETRYYQIRRSVFWGLTGILICLIGAAYFRTDLYEWWISSRGRESVSFEGMESRLESKEECLLCGRSGHPWGDQYGESSGIGVISLNDWYILELQARSYGKSGLEDAPSKGLSTTFGNTGELSYCSKSTPARGMASMEITLPDNYSLNPQNIQDNLCQDCLDKVAESLRYSKWKNEKKEAVPLCLADLETLEIYSLQDWHRGCLIRDYWIEIEQNREKVEIKLFSVPDKR